MRKLTTFFITALLCLGAFAAFGQSTVRGTVYGPNNEPLIGASILVKGKLIGTATDADGTFEVSTDTPLPIRLIVSMVGMRTQEIVVESLDRPVSITMQDNVLITSDIVVSASRIQERILESPVSIEKMDATAIKQSASADYYDELAKLKGVFVVQGSLNFTSINTRGFGGIGNTRFVQLMDGMDNAAPLLNFPTGNIVGISELDIQDMELVPGASAALYGPNAFNGILLMNSKNPFNHRGLSAQVRGGFTNSTSLGLRPMYSASLRYANAVFNNRLGYKFNVSYSRATDWAADRYNVDRITGQPVDLQFRLDTFSTLAGTPSIVNNRIAPPKFDGMNSYGDEIVIPVAGGVTRTGWREEDLLDNNLATSFKADAALHYRISDKVEAIYNYRIGSGNSVYQGSERYALRNFIQQFHKAELRGGNFFVRAYASLTDDGDSYNLTALGSYINESVFPSAVYFPGTSTVAGGWAAAYSQAFNGAFSLFGIPAGNHEIARAFADAGGLRTFRPDQLQVFRAVLQSSSGLSPEQAQFVVNAFTGRPRPEVGSPEYQAVLDSVRTGLFQRGGAGFIDQSRLYHGEFNYDFSEWTRNIADVQIGGNLRRYSLFTDGTVFNEDPEGTGTNSRINIDEFGAYVQATRRLLNERLRISGSLRYDKNQNFQGRVTPRVSTVYTLGESREHNFRASYQTGFRNPSTQAQYIYFPTSNILLGGARENAERYRLYEGGAYTQQSWSAFLASDLNPTLPGNQRDSSLLVVANLPYVSPEQLSSYEIGYKGIIAKRLYLDVNFYYNIYKNFETLVNVVSRNTAEHRGTPVPIGTAYRAYTNISDITINSWGAGLGFGYRFDRGFTFSGNYSYSDLDFDENNEQGFESQFNTPRHRVNLSLENRDKLVRNTSFALNWRWQDAYLWQNSFGTGIVPAFNTLDFQVGYTLTRLKTTVKLGATNLLRNEYFTNTGGPTVGSMYYITLTFDEALRSN